MYLLTLSSIFLGLLSWVAHPAVGLLDTKSNLCGLQDTMCEEQFFNISDLEDHSTRFDCWYLLYGIVYNFTDYVDMHPGGARRLFQYCGMNATAMFMAEKKHDEALLLKEDSSIYAIGKFGSESGLLQVPCE